MAKLNALNKQASEVDMANVPEQFGDFAPPPQPVKAHYTFQLPRFGEDTDWYEYPAAEGRQRLLLNFGGNREKPGAVDSLIIAESPIGEGVGDPVRWRLTTEERKFGSGDGQSPVSPAHYLMKESFGEDPTGWSSTDFALAFIRHSMGRFRAQVVWTSYCNPENDRYVFDEAQNKSVKDEGNKGCGQRWGLTERTNKNTGEITGKIPQDEAGRWLSRFNCACGAYLSVFTELRNFKAAEGEETAPVHPDPTPEAAVQAPVKQQAAAPAQAAPAVVKQAPAAAVKGSNGPVAPSKPAAGSVPPKPSAPRPQAQAPAKK